jgi:hypothetical protein
MHRGDTESRIIKKKCTAMRKDSDEKSTMIGADAPIPHL